MSEPLTEWLTVNDLAEWLQVPTQTVYRCGWINTGPPAYRISQRCIRFRREDVEAWMEQHRDKPTGDEEVAS